MAVTPSCDPGKGAVGLAVSGGEYLEYRIVSADDNVQYALVSGGAGVILDRAGCPPPCVRRWPAEGASPSGREEHTLGMQFFGDETLCYEVDRKAATGEVIEVVKRCDFQNNGSADEYFEGLTVILS